MQNQLSKTDRLSNQDIRKRVNVKKTIIGVLILLIGLSHLPEAVLLNIDEISSGNILYLITCILICAIGIYQLKFRSKEMKYLQSFSKAKEKIQTIKIDLTHTKTRQFLSTAVFLSLRYIKES